MVRALPSTVPPKMYRHFALVTVLLTTGVAMFADGENREARATQVEERAEPGAPPQQSEKVPEPAIARRTTQIHRRFGQEIGEFDASFGAPMDRALGSLGAYTTEVASEVSQAGYSDAYLSSLGAEERDLLLKGLAREGLLSPEERERKSDALIAASEARSGVRSANY
jgi:hypothetical protein